jgi:hypothetical protein
MKFSTFKFGKSNDKGKEKGKASAIDTKATQIAELEGQLNDRTDDLKQTEKKLKKLSSKVDDISGIEPVRPHGPIGELSIESGDPFAPDDPIEAENIDTIPKEGVEDIKLVEVKPEAEKEPEPTLIPASAPAPAAEKVQKSDSIGDSLKDLFLTDEEEENLLANLIYSLPEVTTDELEEDLKEIKNIIKDWQKK